MSTEVSVVTGAGKSSKVVDSREGVASGSAGVISGLACKCLEDEFTDFLIKEDSIVCACCGREIRCVPPIRGMVMATCGCCISTDVKTTFILDSKGAYTCTWCGRSR